MKVLVVDDDKMARYMLVSMLSMQGYDCLEAANGSSALEVLQDQDIDILIVDWMMPEMDGIELCRRIRNKKVTRYVYIIMLTSKNKKVDLMKGFDAGVDVYLEKPPDFDTLNSHLQASVRIVNLERELVLEKERVAQLNADLERKVEARTAQLKATVEQVQAAKDEAEAANIAKGQFLTNMSHELRTPLNGILSAVEIIAASDSIAEAKEINDIIKASGNALLEMVEKILSFSEFQNKKTQLELEPFSLRDVLNNLKTKFFIKGEYVALNLTIDSVPDDLPQTLIGDAGRLIDVLNHLLENAAKFCTVEPAATLRVQIVDTTKETIGLSFSLSDNGIGIDRNNLKKIFDMFVQVDTSSTRGYDGAGIGLSLCRQFVALMDGRLEVESQLGKGSKFHFTAYFKLP